MLRCKARKDGREAYGFKYVKQSGLQRNAADAVPALD